MSLAAGSRLCPYEITARIGAGGMDEVYRATDTNLKRAVALKVLPDSVASDAERLARFQREAELLASLNHPNIAQIPEDASATLVMPGDSSMAFRHPRTFAGRRTCRVGNGCRGRSLRS
jgi:eukaryotic-like serine/threonine-protein kinase